MNKGGFSWKRATGINNAKRKISKATGIPLTKSGRQRKAGAAIGCGVILMIPIIIVLGSVSHIHTNAFFGVVTAVFYININNSAILL